MTQEELQSFARAKGYKPLEDGAVGIVRGCPFFARRQGSAGGISVIFTLGRKLPGGALRELRRQLPGGWTAALAGNRLTLTAGKKADAADSLSRVLELAAEMLERERVPLPKACPLCKDRERPCDGAALIGDGYVPVHQGCCRSRAEASREQTAVNEATGGYLKGLAGALLAGLVAALPVVLAIWKLEKMYSLLYALIPLGAYQGYRLAGGRMNRGGTGIVVAVSVLQLFVIEQLLFYLAIVDAFGAYPSILETVALYFRLMTPGEIAADMAGSFFFLLLGLWISLRTITKTNTTQLRSAQSVLESLQPFRKD